MKKEKKRMKKAACLLLCMMLSCGAASTEVPAAQTTNAVTVYQGTHSDSSDAKMFSLLHFISSVSINKGCSKRLPKAIWMTGTRISYSSSNNKVVSVNSKGMIRGNKTGKAVITIKVMKGTKVTYVKVRVSVCDGRVKGRR